MDNIRQQLCTTSVKPSTGLVDELDKHTNTELIDMLATTAFLPFTSTALLPLSPIRVPYRPRSPFLSVYRSLLSAILQQSGYVRTIARSAPKNMMIAVCQPVHAVVVPNNELCRLFMQLGVPFGATLFVKPCVIGWLTSISSISEDVVSFGFGFYVAPTSQIFRMVKTDDQLPPFIANAKHGRIQDYQLALNSAKHRVGVQPVLIKATNYH